MRSFILFLFLISTLFAYNETAVSKVVKVTRKATTIEINSDEAREGMSAIVIRTLSNDDEIVGYKCEVTAVKESVGTLNCIQHNGFEQEAMPRILFEIKTGDKVILTPLGKRGVIIAPTQNVYIQTKNMLKDYEFVSSDLLSAPLFSDDNPFPKVDDFQQLCERYLVGSVIFGFKGETSIVDCQTFKEIEVIPNNFTIKEEEIVKPFFHRLEKIETGFWHWFGAKEIKDFDTYYKGLINAK